jgi:hypothetical protein
MISAIATVDERLGIAVRTSTRIEHVDPTSR